MHGDYKVKVHSLVPVDTFKDKISDSSSIGSYNIWLVDTSKRQVTNSWIDNLDSDKLAIFMQQLGVLVLQEASSAWSVIPAIG